jgi:hypothetical protein
MMKRDWHSLFADYDLRAVLEAQLQSVKDRVLKLERGRFDVESDEGLAAHVASELVVRPLLLLEDEITVASRDAKVDISHDINRAVWDRSRPAYIDGLEVTYHVPYSGDPELLKCAPSVYTSNPPRAVLGRGELQFPYDQAERDATATKEPFLRDLALVKEWIPRVNSQVEEYNVSLEERVRAQITQRRADLSRTQLDLASLGFKIKTTDVGPDPRTAPSSSQRGQRRVQARAQARKIYDVALSFAGEDRKYVEEVAQHLKALGLEVFYDGFEQVTLWGKDLAEHLGDVYGKDSRFVVLFLSRAYASKAWPSHEKRFALARQLTEGVGRILPVRFDDTEVPGLPETIAFLDLRVLTPVKLSELIRQKVDTHDA